MTTVEILFRYAAAPGEGTAGALAGIKDVYGIRRLVFDREARILRIEYDATRLSPASVAKLVRDSGLDVEDEPPPVQPHPAAEPAPAS